MQTEGTLLLRRRDIEPLLTLRQCIDAVEEVFRLQGQGKIPATGILGVKAADGGLHIKAGLLPRGKNYIVAKLNTNYPGNRARSGLPTIQGLIVLCDGDNGCPLAVLDSIDITIKRTAAASAVAAKYLARTNSSVATICGCGQQARAQVPRDADCSSAKANLCVRRGRPRDDKSRYRNFARTEDRHRTDSRVIERNSEKRYLCYVHDVLRVFCAQRRCRSRNIHRGGRR
jgi:hypothetical protein